MTDVRLDLSLEDAELFYDFLEEWASSPLEKQITAYLDLQIAKARRDRA